MIFTDDDLEALKNMIRDRHDTDGRTGLSVGGVRALLARLEAAEAERDMYKSALERICAYGEALQPNPVHPVTFNACSIAYEVLRRKAAGK